MIKLDHNTWRFAHSLPENPDQTRWEPLGQHLQAVAERAAAFAPPFGLGAWAKAAGLLHDIGKNSAAFQAYIRGAGPSPDHSTAGAVAAKERYKQAGALLAFTIAGHHAGLPDGTLLAERLQKPLPDYAGWEAHTCALPALTPLQQHKGVYPGYELSFLTRMVFSCLVDADFLETERFYNTAAGLATERGNYRKIVELRDRLSNFMVAKAHGAAPTPLNQLRAKILHVDLEGLLLF